MKLLLEFPHIAEPGKFEFDFRLEDRTLNTYREFVQKIKDIVSGKQVSDYSDQKHSIKLNGSNEIRMFKNNILNNFMVLYYLNQYYKVSLEQIKKDILGA
jgi:hypothetical protein